LGVGGMPFLLPLLYQLGLGMPAWQSGLLMMPAAAAAMFMKFISSRVLARFGYRRILIVNTVIAENAGRNAEDEMGEDDLADLIKPNYFQFRTTKQFIALLGESASTLADIDYDPDTLVPAVKPHMAGYTPELDPDLTTRDQRAQYFHNQFIFTVAPNSILAINGADRRMIAMQEVRSGLRDFWSYHETMETPNVGAPPAIPLPPLEPIPPEVQAALVQQLMLNAQGGLVNAPLQAPDGKSYTFDPASGQLLEVRVPQTITERLVAQNLMGIGQVANSAGRKASGQEAPKMESKGDEPGGRTTITESSK